MQLRAGDQSPARPLGPCTYLAHLTISRNRRSWVPRNLATGFLANSALSFYLVFHARFRKQHRRANQRYQYGLVDCRRRKPGGESVLERLCYQGNSQLPARRLTLFTPRMVFQVSAEISRTLRVGVPTMHVLSPFRTDKTRRSNCRISHALRGDRFVLDYSVSPLTP